MKLTGTLFLSLLSAISAYSATWTNATGNGDWFDPGNWAEGVVPTSGQLISSTDDYAVIDADYTQNSFYATGMNVEVNNGGKISVSGTGDIATVGQNAGNKSSLVINEGGRVELTYTAFNSTKMKFYIGLNEGSEGTVTVNTGGSFYIANGGSLEGTHAGVLIIGQGGKGTFNVFGGDVDVRHAWLGASTANGYGEVNVTAGTFKARTNMNIGNNYAANGVVNVSGTGLVQGMYVAVGNQGEATGIINVSGNGTFTGTSRIRLGSETGSKGIINVTDDGRVGSASVFVANATPSGEYGAAEGTINLAGRGTLAANTLYLGQGGTGTVNINSETAVVERYSGEGIVTIQSGTAATADGILHFNYGAGTYSMAHTIGVISGNNHYTKIKVIHNATGTTTLSGNSVYANGTYLNAGKIVADHNKALGNGILYINGGTFEMSATNHTLATGGVDLTTGTMNLQNDEVDQITLTDAFEGKGGVYSLDILSDADFDQILASGGLLSLANMTITLSGYSDFEAYEDGYQIFSGFAALSEEIVDRLGTVTINGYDKENWEARIDTTGRLYFIEATPIPEPGTASLSLVLLGTLALRRRNRA